MSPTAPTPAGTEPFLVTLGEIGVTDRWVVTPAGSFPLQGSQWIQSNNVQTTENIPTWAIVMMIIFFLFCFLGLLFLLVKERKTSGYVQVSVQADGTYYATQVPVSSTAHVVDVVQRLNYVRSLAARP